MSGALQAAAEALIAPHLKPGGPGAVVAISRDGERLLQAAFGMADVATGVPLTPQTRLPIASVTKHMTGMCAAILAEEGRLDLDAPVGCYVSDLAPAVGRPTLRRLLTHTTGLRCHLDVQFLGGFGPRPDGFAMRTIRAMRSTNAEPGALQLYGNAGFHLVARAIEAATGLSFAQAMQARVFAPLDLTQTAVVSSGAPSTGDAALYAADGEAWRDVGALRHESLGEGGVASTLEDMTAWARALRTEDARLPKAAWAEMKRPAPGADGAPSGYGLGLVAGRHRGVEVIGHGGMIYGASSSLVVAPAHGVEVVLLANVNLPTETIARDLLVAAVGQDAFAPAPAAARTRDWPGALDGLFRADALVARFLDLDGALGVSLQGSPGLPVLTGAEGLFVQGAFGPIPLSLPRGPDGDRLEVRMGGETHVARRRRDPAPDLDALSREVAGTYACAEFDSEIALAPGGGAVAVRTRGPYGSVKGRATPLAADLLLVEIPFASFLLTLRREGGRVTALAYDTPRTRALPFLRLA